MHSPVGIFSLMLGCAALGCAVLSWQAFIDFVVGVTTILAAAAIAGTDFE
jgi:hypothetical protein